MAQDAQRIQRRSGGIHRLAEQVRGDGRQRIECRGGAGTCDTVLDNDWRYGDSSGRLSRGAALRSASRLTRGPALVAGRGSRSGGRAGIGGWTEGGAAGGGHRALELGDAGLDFRLEAVLVERALVISERLHVVALLVAEA